MTAETLRIILHYSMHLLVPGVIAFLFFRSKWLKVWGIFILTMAVDLDHLLAVPVFDGQRCSIGFHPLHSYYAIGLYVIGLYPKQTRIIALGLLLHMLTDWIDCMWIVN
jgi:hypothetical protein